MKAFYKVVIFDWDGTLMDSIARIVSSMQAAAKFAGIDVPSDNAVRSIIGMSLQPAVEKLFGSVEPLTLAKAAQEYREQYISKNDTPAPMFAGAESLFRILQKNGSQLAVATGKSRAGLNRVFEQTGLEHYFVTSRCADESKSKPDPEMLLQIVDELNVAIEDCVFVGDTVHDMTMAQKIGMDRIGVTMGVDSAETLASFQPVVICNSLDELANRLSDV